MREWIVDLGDRHWNRPGRRMAIALIAVVVLAGCGAEELYKPPVAPYSVIGRLAMPSGGEGVAVLGDVVCVAAAQAGLVVVDISDPTQPVMVKRIDTFREAKEITMASTVTNGVVADIAFVVEGTEGITTYDVTDPANAYAYRPGVTGTTAVDATNVFVEEPDAPGQPFIVYQSESWWGMRIFEQNLTLVGDLLYFGVYTPTPGHAEGIAAKDGFAYVADDELGCTVVDCRVRVLGPVAPVSSCDTPGNAYDLAVDRDRDFVYIADGENGLIVMETSLEGEPPVPVPHVVAHLPLNGESSNIATREGLVVIAAEDGGVHFVDVTNPSAPRHIGTVVTSFARDVAIAESGLVIVGDREEGLLVLAGGSPFTDVTPPGVVSNLAATGVAADRVRLTWTAPGDDDFSGVAAAYDIRYAETPIATGDDWDAATVVDDIPEPSPRGSAESLDITGLVRGATYYAALKTVDGDGNWSALSNVASATTPTDNSPPLLTGASATPEVGVLDTMFTFEVTYQDGDGDPPTTAQVLLNGEAHAMTLISGDYVSGALYRFETTLPAGDYVHTFTFADGINPPVATGTTDGPWVGTFLYTVGSPETEAGRRDNEPEHEVAMRWQADELLAWGHEVTQAEYEALMGSNPSAFSGDDLPVERVTWLDAVRYCNALSGDSLEPAYTIMGDAVIWNLDADGWRLPTEAEWEMLCRAGTTTAFANGDLADWACGSNPALEAIGWYCGNAGATTHAVAGKEANSWGLHDMHGNVAEWCWNRYTDTPGPSFSGPTTGDQRVVRGGDWYYYARDCRSAARTGVWANSGTDRVGFRVVRTHR